VILNKMAELGYITKQQAIAAKKEGVSLVPQQTLLQTNFKAPYFTNYVLRQLVDKYGYDSVYKGGMKVYTTLNWKMQQEAERALINGVMNKRRDGVTEGALVCLEQQTGYIRAMAGGIDFKKITLTSQPREADDSPVPPSRLLFMRPPSMRAAAAATGDGDPIPALTTRSTPTVGIRRETTVATMAGCPREPHSRIPTMPPLSGLPMRLVSSVSWIRR
jgi:hypothetical protein